MNPTYRKFNIQPDEIDGILSSIPEEKIQQWFAAKLLAIRRDRLPQCNSIDATAHAYAWECPDVSVFWNSHGPGQCALTHSTVDACIEELRACFLDNPQEKAREARRKARQLIEEAEALENVK
jgi:hypothetical protein